MIVCSSKTKLQVKGSRNVFSKGQNRQCEVENWVVRREGACLMQAEGGPGGVSSARPQILSAKGSEVVV